MLFVVILLEQSSAVTASGLTHIRALAQGVALITSLDWAFPILVDLSSSTSAAKGQPVLFGAAVCHPEQFFSHYCSATEQTRGGMLIVVCVSPFIFVIDAALLFLYGIMFFVYAHSLGCHRTHFPAPHSSFYVCFSLPIHIWLLSVDCCIMVPPHCIEL
jgi:hypothetical protein